MQKIIEYLNKNNVEFEKIDENEIGIFPEEDGESEISIIKDEWGYNIWNNPYYSPIEEEISE
ncbi:MAG: hypothetical protein LBQ24_00485 [Candidatus Peribacteria bacterium]|jgi:hypothetical protein|nr:hypothetical protein [Candidatus Peribacteria bacterium]